MDFTNDELAIMIDALREYMPNNESESLTQDALINQLDDQLKEQRM